MKKCLLCVVFLALTSCSPVLHLGFGGAIVDHVPNGILTGQEQFHIMAEVESKISDRWSVVGGVNHYSNGAGLGIGSPPNQGMNFVGWRVQYGVPLW